MPARPTFTPLPEAELSELFHNDPEGLRRYHLLHALLVEGKTQREAAELGQVSERTVRNILRAYSQSSGLEALRSRSKLGRRKRDRRPSEVERALASALAEDPEAGGDRLWRRAQELLGDDAGARLSRRTAYRMLTQLRSADEDPPDSLRGAVKAALPLLPEDPPLTLGASVLAQRFLPADLEPLARGLLLQQALREALDALRPAGQVSTIDRNWWPYLICSGEYEASQSRADLQDDLALSASTYSRAKRQGLDRLAALVPQMIERLIESPAVLASQQLPRTPDFVGRRDEQAYYAWRLQTEGLAHIWGLPGSGKTALAAELAADGRRYGQMVLWHTCRVGRDASLLGIVRGLAQALAAGGDDSVWRNIRQTPPEELNASGLLEALRERLLARPAVVILDDIHHADAEETAVLLDALADLVVRRSSRLLLVGRAPIDGVDFAALPGLAEPDAALLWVDAPILPAEQWQQLYATTGGLPEPIRRAAALYRRNSELARPNDWAGEVAAWAREAIWERLADDERQLLAAAHALEALGWYEQPMLICEALGITAQALAELQRRNLLIASGAHARANAVVAAHAAGFLREHAQFREQVAALQADLAALCDAAQRGSAAQPAGAPETAPPSELDLLARVVNALAESAGFLQEHSDDEARQLAAELAALQAALPKLGPGGRSRPPS